MQYSRCIIKNEIMKYQEGIHLYSIILLFVYIKEKKTTRFVFVLMVMLKYL